MDEIVNLKIEPVNDTIVLTIYAPEMSRSGLIRLALTREAWSRMIGKPGEIVESHRK